MKKTPLRMTGPQLAGVVFGLFIIVVVALVAARGFGKPSQEPVVVRDTVAGTAAATDSTKAQKPHKPRKSTRRLKPEARHLQLAGRDHLDEIVSPQSQSNDQPQKTNQQ